MPTVASNLYVDNAGNTLLFDALGGSPALPAMNAGDTLALSVYYLDRGSSGSPYKGARYVGSSTTVRLRAAGNNTIYATGANGSEIIPGTTSATLTKITNGSWVAPGAFEKQRVLITDIPFTGFFKITFSPTNSSTSEGWAPLGTVTLPVTSSSSNIAAAINALPWVNCYTSRTSSIVNGQVVYSYQGLDPGPRNPISVSRTGAVTDLQFDILWGNYGFKKIAQIDSSDVQWAYGWNVSVPLTNASFTDLFLANNAPAWIEVLLTPSGGTLAYAAQYQLQSSAAAPGGPPPPVGGGGGGTGSSGGLATYLDGDYSIASAIDTVRTERPFPQVPADIIYRQNYCQLQDGKSALAIDSSCPYNGQAKLVEEGPDSTLGAGIVQWERVWATIPSTRIEREVINYPYQQTYFLNNYGYVISLTLVRLARVTHSYYRTTDPSSIALSRLPRAVALNGGIVLLDGFMNLNSGANTIARDDTLDRWMGNIWHKTHWEITI